MVYRVYLVDDDRFLLDLYAVKFRTAGHEVSVFGSGEELLVALRKAGTKAPDAILLDLVMPGIGGFGALEEIRKGTSCTRCKDSYPLKSGKDSDIEKAKQLAADGYIIKASAIPSEVFAETLRTIESGSSAEAH